MRTSRLKTHSSPLRSRRRSSCHGSRAFRRAHNTRTRVLLLVRDLDIRIISAATGELLANSPSTPAATTSPPDSHRGHRPEHPALEQTPTPDMGSGSFRCLATSHCALGGTRTPNLLIRSQPSGVVLRRPLSRFRRSAPTWRSAPSASLSPYCTPCAHHG